MEIYNKSYYLRHLSYSQTETEKALTSFRLDLFEIALKNVMMGTVVDYGCSHGAFLKGVQDSFDLEDSIGVDINPFCVAHCVSTRLHALSPEMFDYFFHDKRIAIMSFWDVFEHLPNPKDVLDRFQPDAICLSMPCLDGWHESHPGTDIQLWKHWRPLEHLWNFTLAQLIEYVSLCGYDVIYTTFDESKIRRDDRIGAKNIMSLVAKRRIAP